jgi:hypothetical protein
VARAVGFGPRLGGIGTDDPIRPRLRGPSGLSRRSQDRKAEIAMMWYWGSGYGWGMALFGVVVMFLFWAGIALAIVYLVRSVGGSRPRQRDIAFGCPAAASCEGDITSEEFERINKVLQG